MFAGFADVFGGRVEFDSVSARVRPLAGPGGRRVFPDQMEFSPIQQLPFDFFARLQPNGGGQWNGKIDVEFGFLPFGTNGLHFERIFCWIFHI